MADDDFERFADAHVSALAALAYRLTGHRASAHDLVQDALLAAFRRWPQVLAADNRSAYVRRILVHQHLNHIRRRMVEIPHADMAEVPQTLASSPDSDAVDERDAMWRALAALTGRQRAVLVLRFYEGLEDSAIAELIECRESTVRSLTARGLRALRGSAHLQHLQIDQGNRRATP